MLQVGQSPTHVQSYIVTCVTSLVVPALAQLPPLRCPCFAALGFLHTLLMSGHEAIIMSPQWRLCWSACVPELCWPCSAKGVYKALLEGAFRSKGALR